MSRLKAETANFEESARPLRNPNRGFYHIYPFSITDEPKDYAAEVEQFYSWDEDTTLALVEINLKEYRAGDISQAGLEDIDALFRAFSAGDKRLIVRFVYDLEGKNLLTEPRDLDCILRHMEQLKEILYRYADDIFTLQGLFIGDWGEMHNTRFDSAQDMRRLAQKLSEVTPSRLAVRTPAQWRMITQDGADAALAARLGLFNDGILGSENDLGTYDLTLQGEQRRSRKEELAFQDSLCREVPNGGETVADNPYNDFENAARDLSTMRVTYLNKDYDQAVLEKWAKAEVTWEGCFKGMDGLAYIERHLGYRLWISGAAVERNIFRQQLTVKAAFKNAGFAPVYEEPEAVVTVLREDDGSIAEYPTEHALRSLSGGSESEKTASVRAVIPTAGMSKGVYKIYLAVRDPLSGRDILLANTQDIGPYGYCLGEIEVRR